MTKSFKVLLAFSIVVLFSISGVVKAEEQSSFLLEQQKKIKELEDKMGEDIIAEVMNQNDVAKVEESLNQVTEYTDFQTYLEQNGFKEVNVDKKETQLKYTLEKSNETVYMISKIYESEDSYIATLVQYNSYNEQIGVIYGEERDKANPDEVKEIISYNDYDEINNSEIGTYDFEWNGKAFACNMTGVFACIQFCGVWHFVNLPAGITCDIACGGAFAIACMGA